MATGVQTEIMKDIRILPNADSLAKAAADYIIEVAAKAIAKSGRFSIALSGGSTPRALYQLLAAEPYIKQINWQNVHFFWGDERCVPPDDADSCYRMARESLLNHISTPAAQIYRIHGELKPAEAAEDYEKTLRAFFLADLPCFDLILLGMGDDGHTASLFPNTTALDETDKWVTSNYVTTVKQNWRVTLTAPAINAAANIAFLVSGLGKAERLQQVLHGEYQPRELPSQLINPTEGNLIWFIDQPAAAKLA